MGDLFPTGAFLLIKSTSGLYLLGGSDNMVSLGSGSSTQALWRVERPHSSFSPFVLKAAGHKCLFAEEIVEGSTSREVQLVRQSTSTPVEARWRAEYIEPWHTSRKEPMVFLMYTKWGTYLRNIDGLVVHDQAWHRRKPGKPSFSWKVMPLRLAIEGHLPSPSDSTSPSSPKPDQKTVQERAVMTTGRVTGQEGASSSGTAATTTTGGVTEQEGARNSGTAAMATIDESQQVDVEVYIYGELAAVTSDFSSGSLLGGVSRHFYKGTLQRTNQVVAMKQLELSDSQGEATLFIAQLSNLRHCNLVELIGHYAHGDHMLVVYEYMPSWSLKDNLHKFDWNTRMKIASGAVEAPTFMVSTFLVSADILSQTQSFSRNEKHLVQMVDPVLEDLYERPHLLVAFLLASSCIGEEAHKRHSLE